MTGAAARGPWRIVRHWHDRVRRFARAYWVDIAWAIFIVLNLIAMRLIPAWQTVPFLIIWISLTAIYGFRLWHLGSTVLTVAVVTLATGGIIGWQVVRGEQDGDYLAEVPLLAAMFVVMAWHARRRAVAMEEIKRVSEHNLVLLGQQRQFLQDVSHELGTPITIALGHAELLAGDLTGQQQGQDIQVVIGELSRLRRIAERLLLIAAAGDPGFLHAEVVALDRLIMELIRRWRPTADRSWQLGRLDPVTVRADRERLGLALDALLENAVRHTATGNVIQLSVIRGWPGRPVRIIVADGGNGIPEDRLHLIFDRFRTGDDHESRGTGLGLPLVRAVARAHGGDVTVRSKPGSGSEFELTLPAPPSGRPELPAGTGATAPDGADGAPDQSPAADHGQEQQGSARR